MIKWSCATLSKNLSQRRIRFTRTTRNLIEIIEKQKHGGAGDRTRGLSHADCPNQQPWSHLGSQRGFGNRFRHCCWVRPSERSTTEPHPHLCTEHSLKRQWLHVDRMKDAPVKPFRVRIDLNKNPVLLNYMKNSHIRDAAPKSLESLWRNRLARQTVNLKVGGSSPPRDGYFCLPLPVQKRQLAWWRNGSASDSRSEGCVFKSRPGHRLFYFFRVFFLKNIFHQKDYNAPKQCPEWGSNSRPSDRSDYFDYETDALPTALSRHICTTVR